MGEMKGDWWMRKGVGRGRGGDDGEGGRRRGERFILVQIPVDYFFMSMTQSVKHETIFLSIGFITADSRET